MTTEPSEVIAFPRPASQKQDSTKTFGYTAVRFNALKHGVLSQYTVLAHEDVIEFGDLLAALAAEHLPSGPTETHLVEELASAIWRKRRVLQAEGATINRGLLAVATSRHDRVGSPAQAALPFEPSMAESWLNSPPELAEAIRQTDDETKSRAAEADEDLAATVRAASILRRGGARSYERALRVLIRGPAELWEMQLEEEEVAATAEDLAKVISDDFLPMCRQAVLVAQNHAAIKAQTLGEGLQAHRLEKLNRYETHLDRKFERTLAMLLKLKELRRGA